MDNLVENFIVDDAIYRMFNLGILEHTDEGYQPSHKFRLTFINIYRSLYDTDMKARVVKALDMSISYHIDSMDRADKILFVNILVSMY